MRKQINGKKLFIEKECVGDSILTFRQGCKIRGVSSRINYKQHLNTNW